MNRWKGLLICFLSVCSAVSATDNLRLPDIRTLGMGGNGGAHSAFFNPALLGVQTSKSFRADYYNRYRIKELATLSAGLCLPNQLLPIGLHIASFGYDEYRESLFRLSAGKQLSDNWSLGIGVQYALLQSEMFESDAARISADLGIVYQASDNLSVGLSAINFPSVTLNDEYVDAERLGTYLAELNVNWYIVDNVLLTGGLANSKDTPFSASAGMEYLPLDEFTLRAGIRTAPLRPSLGAGYTFSGITVDVAMVYHPVLGVSLGLGLSYSF
ncbi:MAG: TonB-dependent receptor [Tannerella sp.]|jgi:hypothetical protein|nr:TonB-dependent receptor [Tannerella sp.]